MKMIKTLHKVEYVLKRISVAYLCGISVLSFVACQESDEAIIDSIYAVDLGLSVKWAWCNVGANLPKDQGNYYAWGEATTNSFWHGDKKNYQHYNSITGAFKYLGSNISGTSYDVAHMTMGDDWRMPTKEELQELIDECTWEWANLYGDSYYADGEGTGSDYGEGYLITGLNGNQIFLPAGWYWSGTNESFGTGDPKSYLLATGVDAEVTADLCYRTGFIRPVKGELGVSNDDKSASMSKTYTVNGVSFKMVGVEKGSFTMGATGEQPSSSVSSDERPTHQVLLSDYAIGETEVTQELWQAVMGSNPSGHTGNLQRPVEGVSWYDCQNFIYKLNQLTGENFRLPTEAEWEYAARGGFNSQRYVYSGGSSVHDVAWYFTNSDYHTHPVKQKQSNELGIYDMSGNVSEWCYDWYGSYSSTAQTDPVGLTQGTNRVLRGGDYNSKDVNCRVSYRSCLWPDARSIGHVGLRLAKSATSEGVPTEQEVSVATGEVVYMTDNRATISGTVYGTDKDVVCGIIYGTSDDLSATSGTMVATTAKGGYMVELTGLEPNTTYYFRAFVVIGEGEYRYASTSKFETRKGIITGDVSNITDSGATISGMVDTGHETECGIIYGTTPDLSATNGTMVTTTAQGEFSIDITELEANTTYYYCAFIVTDEGEYRYASTSKFETRKGVVTGDVSNITDSGATISGMVDTGHETECGIIYGTTPDLSVTNGTMVTTTAEGEFSVDIMGIEANTIYYYCAFIVTDKGEYRYGEVRSFVIKKEIPEGAVDLGLSVYWASCNVGAESPEEYGDYFAWGETTTKSDYSSSISVTYGLSIEELKSRGIIDSDGNLTAEYDAATANWGGNWRMPTLAEMEELIDNCTWEWTTQNGVYGRKVTGPNGNSIFLPAAGYRYGTSLYDAGSRGYYWSASPSSYSYYACFLYFLSYDFYWYNGDRYFGHSVRPVSE